MSDDPITKRIAQTAEAHGLGWIDNGKASARCYGVRTVTVCDCQGFAPRLTVVES